MTSLKPNAPTIAITGSTGKTTTREILASILTTRWKILKTEGNNNLPLNTKNIAKRYDSSYKAVLVELGMGKPGAGERHAKFLIPNIAIITNIGTAHYGSLGNSYEATAKNKSALIHYMHQHGVLLLNNDDENSKLLERDKFLGKIITVGIEKEADYRASDIKFLSNGMSFRVNNDPLSFFIPTYGIHNVYNALFAIAVAKHLNFSNNDIRKGFNNYKPPIKRLNFIPLKNYSILIDDTANANPQSMKTAIDVLAEVGKQKKKIAILADMLELGDLAKVGHENIGRYLAEKNIDAVITYGDNAKFIQRAASKGSSPVPSTIHYNDKNKLHDALKTIITSNSIVLVKGSSSMKMDETVKYIKDKFLSQLILANDDTNIVQLNIDSYKYYDLHASKITVHYGKFNKKMSIKLNNSLDVGTVIVPKILSGDLIIPDLPYEFYFKDEELHIGPVIGMLILPRYKKDPGLQLPRFANYKDIRGLICLFNQADIDMKSNTINGYYYDPKTNNFLTGTFPYPSSVFVRSHTKSRKFKHLQTAIGQQLFNQPYGNMNKLDFWKRFEKLPNIRQNIPFTKRYKKFSDLIEVFSSYNGVYLKPVTLSGGAGIIYITKADDKYIVLDETGEQTIVKTKDELKATLDSKFVDRPYIIQQEIQFQHQNHKVDFRVYIQKNYQKKWQYSGMEAKVAKTGSIISNSKNRERIMQGETALRAIYKLSEVETVEKVAEITNICKKILIVLDKKDCHLGDVAIDFIIDNNNKVWILEVQPNYATEIKALREAGEQLVLPKIMPTPFEYAKALTGF